MASRIALALALALSLFVAEPSAAHFHDERPADARTMQMVAATIEHFSPDDRARCPNGVRAWYAPDLSDAFGAASGRGGNCEIWLESLYVSEWRADEHDPDLRAETLDEECAVVAHEVGHALGLGHAESGVMAPAEGANVGYVPAACRRYRRSALRVQRLLSRWRHPYRGRPGPLALDGLQALPRTRDGSCRAES